MDSLGSIDHPLHMVTDGLGYASTRLGSACTRLGATAHMGRVCYPERLFDCMLGSAQGLSAQSLNARIKARAGAPLGLEPTSFLLNHTPYWPGLNSLCPLPRVPLRS